MEIKNESDFGKAKPLFQVLLRTLETLHLHRKDESQLTSVEMWKKNIDLLKELEEGMGSDKAIKRLTERLTKEETDLIVKLKKEGFEGLSLSKITATMKKYDKIMKLKQKHGAASSGSDSDSDSEPAKAKKAKRENKENKENLRTAFKELTLPMIYSYYLSAKLMENLGKEGDFEDFELHDQSTTSEWVQLYQKIYTCLSKCKENDFTTIEQQLKICLGETFAKQAKGLSNSCEMLKKLHNVYWCTKEFLIPEMTERKISKELTNGKAIRKASVLMEYIGKNINKKYKDKPNGWFTIGNLQNELVRLGLHFREKGYPGFEFGAQTTFANILASPRSNLATAFIIEKIIEPMVGKLSSEGMDIRAIETKLEIVRKSLQASAEKNKDADSETLIDEFTEILQEFQTECGFTNEDIYHWTVSLHYVLLPYERFKNELGKKSSDDTLRLLIVGDSVSAGLGISTSDPNCDQRWTAHLADLLKHKLKFNYEAVNCSIPGHTTESGSEFIEGYLDNYAPDVVVCTLGGNDIYGKSIDDIDSVADEIEKNMLSIVEKCHQKGINQVIWGLGIPSTFFTDPADCDTWRKKLHEIMTKVAEQAATEFNVKMKVAMLTPDALTKENMLLDNLHPKAEGHNIIVNQTINALEVECQKAWMEKNSSKPKPLAWQYQLHNTTSKSRKENVSQGQENNLLQGGNSKLELAKSSSETLNILPVVNRIQLN